MVLMLVAFVQQASTIANYNLAATGLGRMLKNVISFKINLNLPTLIAGPVPGWLLQYFLQRKRTRVYVVYQFKISVLT